MHCVSVWTSSCFSLTRLLNRFYLLTCEYKHNIKAFKNWKLWPLKPAKSAVQWLAWSPTGRRFCVQSRSFCVALACTCPVHTFRCSGFLLKSKDMHVNYKMLRHECRLWALTASKTAVKEKHTFCRMSFFLMVIIFHMQRLLSWDSSSSMDLLPQDSAHSTSLWK